MDKNHKYRAKNSLLQANLNSESTAHVDSFQNNKNPEKKDDNDQNITIQPRKKVNLNNKNRLLYQKEDLPRHNSNFNHEDEEEELEKNEEREEQPEETKEEQAPPSNLRPSTLSPLESLPPKKTKEEQSLKVVNFIKKNPWVILLIIIIVIFFIIVSYMGIAGEESQKNKNQEGYVSSVCDFNESTVNLKTCQTEEVKNMPIEEYIYGATYAFTKNGDYNDETKKALMIILKTNALSNGLYSNDSKVLNIDDCSISYDNDIPSDEYEKLQNLYTTISDYLYLFDSYKEEIVSLDKRNYLVITNQILRRMDGLSKDNKYDEILNNTYNEEKSNNVSETDHMDLKYQIYNLATYCTYFNLTENDAYWWPIGSKEETAPNIYGGDPTSTRITSYFGPRAIQGTASNHGAIDIGASCNNNVVIAAKEGKVINMNDSCSNDGYYKNKCGGGLGNYVAIEHNDGTITRYGHMYPKTVTVKEGDTVAQGQKLGMVGNSGSSTGCHLHFEVRVNNEKVDPLEYVDPENPRPIANKSINIGDVGDEGGKENVCKALIASGFSKNATAGIMMNIAAESSFRTNAVEYQSGYTIDNIWDVPASKAAGFGLIQWSYGRRINVINYARENNMSPTSLKAQLEYFNIELENSYPVTRKYVTGNYSAYDIGLNFCLDFERPSNKKVTCPNRINNSVDEYTSYVANGCK